MESKLVLVLVLVGMIAIAGCAGYKTADTGADEQDTGGEQATGEEVDVDTSDPLAGSEDELTEVENI